MTVIFGAEGVQIKKGGKKMFKGRPLHNFICIDLLVFSKSKSAKQINNARSVKK